MKIDPRITQWLDQLAVVTDEPPVLTRTFLSPALERAKGLVAGWMLEAGLSVHEDKAGNLIGRVDCGDEEAGTLVCGSHLDTVRNAGRFDGPMGVVAGILAAERAQAFRPGHHIEVVAFSDEEGVRFQTTYLGSRFYTGQLGDAERGVKDREGITVGEAITRHEPLHPDPPARRLLGYVEAHIEQGPVLEAVDLPLGVVTAIAGQTRARVTLHGKAGHAGTTPMSQRRDALAGAAECVLLIERMARRAGDLVATVGQIEVASAAGNVIPGEVYFTIDVRDADDGVRQQFCTDLFAAMERQMLERKLDVRIDIPFSASATKCSARLCDALAGLVARRQGSCPRLVSGAGHDAVALAEVTEVAMLFVRCRGGLSHHPDEFADARDIALAVEVLTDFLSFGP